LNGGQALNEIRAAEIVHNIMQRNREGRAFLIPLLQVQKNVLTSIDITFFLEQVSGQIFFNLWEV